MSTISKIPRGLKVLVVMAILAILVWRFTANTDYYYYSIGVSALITIVVIFVIYHTPRTERGTQGKQNNSSRKTEGKQQLKTKASESVLENSILEMETIPVEADYTDSPSILRDKPTAPFRSVKTKPSGTEVAANYMRMAKAASADVDAGYTEWKPISKVAQSQTEQTIPDEVVGVPVEAVDTSESKGDNTGSSEPSIREDESALLDKEKNELVNAVWCRCENPYCKYTRFLTVHHIIDEKDGGTNKLDNLIVLCPYCHDLAHRNDIPEKEMRDWVSNREERFKFKPQWHYQ